MYKIEYAALKYYNNVLTDECLYIGMLFHNLTTGERHFRHISDFNRFQRFDDEADINFVKTYLTGIKQQVEENIFNYDVDFKIADFTRIYVNEFRFSNVMVIEVEDNENYVEKLTKMYLKFDFKKNKRLSQAEEKKYIKKILSSSHAAFSVPTISGVFEENVKFDYIIGNVAIKIFSFKEKSPAKLISTAKVWSYNAEEVKDQYKVVYLYDDASDDSPQLKIIMQILKEHADIFQIQDGLDYVLKAIS